MGVILFPGELLKNLILIYNFGLRLMLSECPICYNDIVSAGLVIPSSCSHNLCMNCYTNIILKTKKYQCPMCRAPYALYEEKPVYINFSIIFCRMRINLCRFVWRGG